MVKTWGLGCAPPKVSDSNLLWCKQFLGATPTAKLDSPDLGGLHVPGFVVALNPTRAYLGLGPSELDARISLVT